MSEQTTKRPPQSKRLPNAVRAQAIAAGHSAKTKALAEGASPAEAHQAYRSAYNTVRAGYLYSYNEEYRQKNLSAQRKWRGSKSRPAIMVVTPVSVEPPLSLWARLRRALQFTSTNRREQ
jgi:hypothetical protein